MSRRDHIRTEKRSLNPIELIEVTRLVADEVSGGKYPFIDFDADVRWHQRIHRSPRLDIWLIGWLPTQGTELHDHGGSAGSFTVVSGQLAEAVYARSGARAGELAERVREAGHSVGFDCGYVHDVRNLSDAPAVSVHAYSRPLTAMTYYDLEAGSLERLATVDTDDPEPASDLRAAS
jgi:predicted metal-dependent enzyme (double-stranded beta helix superfamily)